MAVVVVGPHIYPQHGVQQTMKLKDILELKQGTLIKGLKSFPKKHRHDSFYLNLDEWVVGGIPSSELKRKEDDTVRVVPLTLVDNRDILKLMDKLSVHKDNASKLRFDELSKNMLVIYELFYTKTEHRFFEEEKIVGMSLGETIVSFYPQASDRYKKITSGIHEICCLHKMLIKDKVMWLFASSKVSVDEYDSEAKEFNLKSISKNSMMEVF